MNYPDPAPQASTSTVYLVEDDPFSSEFIEFLLKSKDTPLRSFHNAEEFLVFYRDCPPPLRGCLLLDQELPEMNGMELFEVLSTEDCLLPVVMVTGNATVPLAIQGTRIGLFEFIEKPVEGDRLVATVHRAFKENERRITEWEQKEEFQQRLATLTPKEREAMELMLTGLPTKILAYRLGISDRTAEKHRQKVMHKLRARNLLDLIYITQQCGLVNDLGELRANRG